MRGHIRRRGKSWALVVDVGRTASGKRKQKWRTIHGTKRDAERALATWLAQLNSADPTGADTHLTVRTWSEEWLQYMRDRVRPSTWEGYATMLRVHVWPVLGGVRLDRLTARQVDAWCRHLQRHDGRQNKLSARTVEYAHAVLSRMLRRAVALDMLSRNPAEKARPPRGRATPPQFAPETGAKLLAAARATNLYVPILLAVTTGMRRGEILGLRWSDIDLDARRVQVQRALIASPEAPGWRFSAPKTATGYRVILLSDATVDALRAHRRQQVEWRLRQGRRYEDQDMVFPTSAGGPWGPNAFGKQYRAFVRQLGLGLTFHDLRHVHATLLLAAGTHPWIVAQRLGQADIDMTRRYSHVMPEMQAAAAAAIDDKVGLQNVCKASEKDPPRTRDAR